MAVPYTIPNDAVAAFADEAQPDAGDFAILGSTSGVISGGAVTANGTNMTLTVASVFALVNGTPLVNAGGSAVIGAASANPRWDLVYVNASNVITVLAGSPTATNPQLPVFDPINGAVLAAIYIPTATSALVANNVIDKRRSMAAAWERILTAASDTFLRARVNADSTDRLKVTGDGKHVWTSGAAGTPNPVLGFDGTLGGLLLTGKFGSVASVATETPLTVTGAGAQSVDLVKIRNSTPTDLVVVTAAGNLTAFNIKRGAGAPNGAVVGNVGDIYMQTDGASGATLWIKEAGNGNNSGWNASGTTSAGLVLGGGQLPTGSLIEWTCSTLPGGFLWADGAAQSRTTFSALNALYAADGYPWGAGNGSTTFNTPDKRGIVTAGAQNFGANGTTGVSDRQIGTTIGGTAGSRNRQLSTTELPPHNHPGSGDSGHIHSSNKRPNTGTTPINAGAGPLEVETVNSAAAFGVTGTGNAAVSITSQGAGGPFEIVQPTQLSRFIVKY